MKLNLSSFYAEPGYEFKISHKVYQLVQGLLEKHIMIPYGLDEKEPKVMIGLDVTTGSKVREVNVKGPDVDKRNNFTNYGIWLPFEPIVSSENVLETFLNQYFDALVILFTSYEVTEGDIRKVQNLTKKEVLGNEDYVFQEEDIPPIDLSDLDL